MMKTICERIECKDRERFTEDGRIYCNFFDKFVDESLDLYCRKLYLEELNNQEKRE